MDRKFSVKALRIYSVVITITIVIVTIGVLLKTGSKAPILRSPKAQIKYDIRHQNWHMLPIDLVRLLTDHSDDTEKK